MIKFSSTKLVPINELPKFRRPRERLANLGVTNLTDQELTAVVLGIGNRQFSVTTLANNLIRHYPLSRLIQIQFSQLSEFPGLGQVQAGRILAAIELGKRAVLPFSGKCLHSATDVIRVVADLVDQPREYLIALFLNGRQELIDRETITIGNLNTNLIEPREILGPALRLPCAHLILVHNHPSGNPTPSQDDLAFTQLMISACDLVGLNLVDHLVIGRQGYYSFKEQGLL